MLSNIPHAIRPPLLWRGQGRLFSAMKKPTLLALPSFGGVGGRLYFALKKPSLFALPSFGGVRGRLPLRPKEANAFRSPLP